jgi:hypothetical protein
MKRFRLSLLLIAILPLMLIVSGCESTGGSVYVGGYYDYGYGYYSPWYRHDVIVRPPPPHRPPVRPEHPIARPPARPPVRPAPLPARPMPSRPMPRPAPARMR